MAATKQNILIFGGTGVIGRFITEALLADTSEFRNVAIFTSASTTEHKQTLLQKWHERGLEIIVGDITKSKDVKAAYERFDTVISALGRNVISEQTNLIKWAEASPTISRFFPSEYGTDIEYYPEQSKHEKPHQQKLKVRKYIHEHVKRLEITYLVTGPYADLYLGKGKKTEYGSFDPISRKATLLGTGDEPVSFTTMEDVGRLVIAALKHPRESSNKVLKVNSFTATPHEILREFEAQTGAKWDITYTSLPVLKQLEEKAYKENDPSATGCTLRRIWTQGGTLYPTRDNELIEAGPSDTLQIAVASSISQATAM